MYRAFKVEAIWRRFHLTCQSSPKRAKKYVGTSVDLHVFLLFIYLLPTVFVLLVSAALQCVAMISV